MYARIRAALDDGTGAIRTSLAYRDDKAKRVDAVPPDYLYRFFETWEAVAEVYGLRWSPPVTGPRPGSKRDKAVKPWIRPLADEERLRNIPGEDEAAAIHAPCVLHAYRVEVSDRVGIVGTPAGDVVMRCVVERMMIR
jgi:hypothetical protein